MNTEHRFWLKVQRGTRAECWPWLGYVVPSGHGLTTYQSEPCYASRKAWILTHGQIRNGQCVLHRCDNAVCCNPEHLYLGDRIDNMIDRFRNPAAGDRQANGRPFMLTLIELQRLDQMRAQGSKLRECAEELRVSVATIVRYNTTKYRRKLLAHRRDRMSHVITTQI